MLTIRQNYLSAVEKADLSEIRKSGSNLLVVKFSTQDAGLHMPS